MEPILSEYLNRLYRRRVTVRAVQSASQAFRHFERFLHDGSLAATDATHDDIEDFVARLRGELAHSTARLYFVQVRAAYSYAVKRGAAPGDPTIDVRLPRPDDIESEVFSAEELHRLESSVIGARESIIHFGLAYSGLRKAELRTLKWRDISLSAYPETPQRHARWAINAEARWMKAV